MKNQTSRLLIFSGAGISAESGLSTFRDTGGLWTQYNVEEVCNFQVFKAAKEDTVKRAHIFEFYNEVKKAILAAKPNAAHYQVAKWQQTYGKDRVRIFTANIDDLFERAGCEEVIHVHGDIYHMQCVACQQVWNVGQSSYDSLERCPYCSSRLTKPRVVFFGEAAPQYQTLQHDFHLKRRNPKDFILYVGSSMSVIPPSRLIQLPTNKSQNIVANLEPQNEDNWFGHHYYGLATEQLPKVDKDIFSVYF